MKQRDIEILSLKSQTHAQTLQKEAAEAAEMHAAISSVAMERDTRSAKRDRLREQIVETHKTINRRLEAQKAHAHRLDAQTRLNAPELAFWEEYLCLRIDGAGREDRLKFVYTHLLGKDSDAETEAWFELGTANRGFDVLHVRPKLDREAVEREVDLLNAYGDFGAFLKRMRKLFIKAVK